MNEIYFILQSFAHLVKFGYLELPIRGLEEWRCVSMALGAPSVMTSGTIEMPVWCADSWDTPHMV